MKKQLQLFLMVIIALIVPLAGFAQQDVTATYLINPGFEEGPTFFHDPSKVIHGWNVSTVNLLDAFLNTNDGTTAPEGLNVFGIWSPGNVGDFEISQTVRNLPAGTYSISCVMTATTGEYTTQRLFVSTPSAGTKALYYESASLDTITGERPSFAGYVADGDNTGPFRLMTLKIKVAAGESLVFGIRSNGTLSSISPVLSTIAKNGNFKVDNFRLTFIEDVVLDEKRQIQEKIDFIKTIPTDTVPRGYIPVISSKIAWGEAVISSQTNIDSLDACFINLTDFLVLMKSSKTKFLNLRAKILECELLKAEWVLPGIEILEGVLTNVRNTFISNSALNADFDKAWIDLDSTLQSYINGRIPENLALKATLTTSYVSGWEKLSAIVDGYEPKSSRDKGFGAYGNWNGSSGQTNWVQFEWPTYMNFYRFDVYWWYDGSTPSNGGVTQPLWAKLEYFKDGAWVLGADVDTAVDKWVQTPFVYNTNKIRLSMAGTVATGILEVRAMGVGTMQLTIIDYKRLIQDEWKIINALNPDSLPKGYASTTQILKAQSERLLLGSDSLGLIANYTALQPHRILLEKGSKNFKALNTSLNTTASAIGSSASTVIKTRLQALYDYGRSVLMSNTSNNDGLDKSTTSLNNYLSFNTRLVSTKASLDKTSSIVRKTAYQFAYDRAVSVFISPTAQIDSVVIYTISLLATQRLADTLATAETLMGKRFFVSDAALKAVYDASLAAFMSLTNVASPLNNARSRLSAALLAYYKNPPEASPIISTNPMVVVSGKEFLYTIHSETIEPTDSIVNYQFNVSFDASKLAFVDIIKDSTISQNGIVNVNHSQNGLLKIGYMGTGFLSGQGALLHLKFKAINVGVTTPIISDYYFNTEAIANISNGAINILTGNGDVNGVSYGDVDGNGLLQSYDATLVLQNSVGLDPIPDIDPIPWDSLRVEVSDVDGDNALTAFDAALILQYSIGLISVFPIENTNLSLLRSASATTPDVTISKEGSNLVLRSYGAILGLNATIQGVPDAIGLPTFVNNSMMKATNITPTNYKIGLATATSPGDGSILLTLPIQKPSDTELIFKLTINGVEKDLKANIATEVITEKIESVKCFPNPVRENLTIDFGSMPNCSVKITNLLGQTVYTTHTKSQILVINMSGFAKEGLYHLQILDKQNNVLLSKKLIKQ